MGIILIRRSVIMQKYFLSPMILEKRIDFLCQFLVLLRMDHPKVLYRPEGRRSPMLSLAKNNRHKRSRIKTRIQGHIGITIFQITTRFLKLHIRRKSINEIIHVTVIKNIFGPKIAQIVDGLTKISGGIFGDRASAQAENFKKLLLTMSDDIRVILIKIADRLHNMRTLGSMLPNKQFKIAGETLYIYAPLANRLGLYKIKTELENLSFKYEHPEEYQEIEEKLAATATERDKVFNDFTTPIRAQLDKMGLDVLIVGRGGGSMEDLWAFNTETVINAVYACKTPIISAVGHETDFTITDFVADMRAPTPSAAAELAVPDREEELRRLVQLESIASRALRSLLERENQRLDSCLARRGSAGAYISTRLERLQALMNGNRQQIQLRLERENTRLERVLEQIEAYSPLAVLRRGYTLVRHTDGSPVTKKEELSPGTALRLQFADGSVPVQVLEEREDE